MMADMTKTRMTAQEFMELPESNQIIELIDGEAVMPPSAVDGHQKASSRTHGYLFQLLKVGELRYSPMDVYFDEHNYVQPDIFWVSPDNDHCHLVDEKYWHGAPDLIIEILSPSTEERDRDDKFNLYQKHGVREYWLVEPEAKFIEVYVLLNGKFERLGVFGRGKTFESPVLGAKVDVTAVLGA